MQRFQSYNIANQNLEMFQNVTETVGSYEELQKLEFKDLKSKIQQELENINSENFFLNCFRLLFYCVVCYLN